MKFKWLLLLRSFRFNFCRLVIKFKSADDDDDKVEVDEDEVEESDEVVLVVVRFDKDSDVVGVLDILTVSKRSGPLERTTFLDTSKVLTVSLVVPVDFESSNTTKK